MSRRPTRRQVLSLLTGAATLPLAGCAEVARSVSEGKTPAGSSEPTGTPTPAPTENRPSTTPGYKENHWHGRLFFEIDGELVDFTEPRYHLDNIGSDEALGFHFHEASHGPNEWSNELRVVTLAEGLNLLPGIGYRQGPGGSHEVTYDETTYLGREGDTEITVHEGTTPVDPTRHYVRHGEVYWLRIDTGSSGPRPPADHPDAETGTLLVDVNNVRLDLSSRSTGAPDGEESALHFHDDGDPNRWYVAGDEVTLVEALDGLGGVTATVESGGLALSLENLEGYGLGQPEKYLGTYRSGDDGTTITVRQRTSDVDPATYALADGDIVWVYVHTDAAPDNEH